MRARFCGEFRVRVTKRADAPPCGARGCSVHKLRKVDTAAAQFPISPACGIRCARSSWIIEWDVSVEEDYVCVCVCVCLHLYSLCKEKKESCRMED